MLRMDNYARIWRASGEPSSPVYTPDPGTVPCELQPIGSTAAFELWGIELSEPSKLFGRVADWSSVQVGDRVEIGSGEMYAVRAPARLWQVGGAVSPIQHAVVLLERVRGAE